MGRQGIECNRHFLMRCAGDIGQVLHAASLLGQLRTLDLSKQAFTGTLPSLSIPTLASLNLADNTIQVHCCPRIAIEHRHLPAKY